MMRPPTATPCARGWRNAASNWSLLIGRTAKSRPPKTAESSAATADAVVDPGRLVRTAKLLGLVIFLIIVITGLPVTAAVAVYVLS